MSYYDEILNHYHDNLLFNYSNEYFSNYQLIIELLKKSVDEPFITKICTDNFFDDLNIFGFNGIIDKIINTQSIIGKLKFQKKLYFPICDIKQLQNRQNNLINILGKNEVKTLLKNMSNFSTCENGFIDLFRKDSKEIREFLNNIYFQNKHLQILNGNAYYQNIFYIYKVLVMPVTTMLVPIITLIFPFLIFKFYYKFPIGLSHYIRIMKTVISNLIFDLSTKCNFVNLFSVIFSLFTYIYTVYQNIVLAIKINRITNLLKNKLINLKKIVEIYDKCYNTMNYLKINLEPINENLKSQNSEIKLVKYLRNLNENDRGDILSGYFIVKENKHDLIPIYEYLGLVDSFLSDITTFMKSETGMDMGGVVMTKFIDSNDSYITIDNFNHLNIDYKKSIPNSIEMNNANKTIIITGPNAAGKSTLMKSILLSVYLSQTLTFAPCEHIEITPFNIIDSYFSLKDLEGEYSLFEAEMKRIKTYLYKISNTEQNTKPNTKPNKHGIILNKTLIAIDEIFNSTNYREGVLGSTIVIGHLNSIKNNLALISTHYHELAQTLDKNDNLTNLYVKSIKNKDGSYSYPYKLFTGINKQTIGLDLIKQNIF